eukprot:1282333-Amphidinium_carterae.1
MGGTVQDKASEREVPTMTPFLTKTLCIEQVRVSPPLNAGATPTRLLLRHRQEDWKFKIATSKPNNSNPFYPELSCVKTPYPQNLSAHQLDIVYAGPGPKLNSMQPMEAHVKG